MKGYDAFCGLGSFHMAGIKHGIHMIGACDIDSYARELYEKNWGLKPDSDIWELDYHSMPDFDIFFGGFPCQPFSSAGKRMGMNERKGNLIYAILDILEIKSPEYFVLENVPGLLSIQKGKTFELILTELCNRGYYVQYAVLCPTDFGVPQHRPRLFIVGCKQDISMMQWPSKTHGMKKCSIYSILEEYPVMRSWNIKLLSDKDISFLRAWNKYIIEEPHLPVFIENPDHPLINALPPYVRKMNWSTMNRNIWEQVVMKYQNKMSVRNDNYFPTLTCAGSPVMITWQNRYITSIEMARCQSLENLRYMPDSYNKAKKLFGNSINSLVAEKVIDSLLNINRSLWK